MSDYTPEQQKALDSIERNQLRDRITALEAEVEQFLEDPRNCRYTSTNEHAHSKACHKSKLPCFSRGKEQP